MIHCTNIFLTPSRFCLVEINRRGLSRKVASHIYVGIALYFVIRQAIRTELYPSIPWLQNATSRALGISTHTDCQPCVYRRIFPKPSKQCHHRRHIHQNTVAIPFNFCSPSTTVVVGESFIIVCFYDVPGNAFICLSMCIYTFVNPCELLAYSLKSVIPPTFNPCAA